MDLSSTYQALGEMMKNGEQLSFFQTFFFKFYQAFIESSREITTPLFLLRCLEVGLSLTDLDLLTIGFVLDIWTEKANDGEDYGPAVRTADQSDFDRF